MTNCSILILCVLQLQLHNTFLENFCLLYLEEYIQQLWRSSTRRTQIWQWQIDPKAKHYYLEHVAIFFLLSKKLLQKYWQKSVTWLSMKCVTVYYEDVYLLLHFLFWHFQEWHFQKCHFQIFSEMIIWIILTLLEKILILTLSGMTL